MTTETRKFDSDVARVLHLVIHSLYTNKDIFLRELISNASDACDKRRFLAQSDPKLAVEGDYKITIGFDEKKKLLVITDNGIGMSREDMVQNLGTIAKSGTQDFVSGLAPLQPPPAGGGSAVGGDSVNLIGQFGVGFYSSFMVADKVMVKSLKAGEKQAFKWESEGLGEYTVDDSDYANVGTEITLHMRKDGQQYLDKHRLSHIVTTYSDHITIPVELVDAQGETTQANNGKALWMRPKSEIKAEEYQQFYKSISHQIDKPYLTVHTKAEGKLEYTALLFIPGMKPFDLYHPDRMRRVKLFVRRVFIAEDTVDIIPRYLRFLRGVVDSEDLPLNISRESLQANPMVDKIRKSLVTKVLAELKKSAKKDAAEYNNFWNNFGPVMKEGLCETMDSKDPLLELCRFYSSYTPTQPSPLKGGGDMEKTSPLSGGIEGGAPGLTSLEDYISRAKPDQEIYYLSGENLEALRTSPQIEGFKKRGIEVLFFTDNVDDFWVSNVGEYQGRKFKSVTRSDIDLGDVEEAKTEDAKGISELVEIFKKELGEKVKDVKISRKLESSPVVLSVGEGDMDIRMEKFLRENRQLPMGSTKILEINPQHKLILALAEKGDTAEVRDIVNLLLDQALIMEGEGVQDLKGFSERMNLLMEKAMAA